MSVCHDDVTENVTKKSPGALRDIRRDKSGVFPKGNPDVTASRSPQHSAIVGAAQAAYGRASGEPYVTLCHEGCHGAFTPAFDADIPTTLQEIPSCLCPPDMLIEVAA